jgi:hypothetical protein
MEKQDNQSTFIFCQRFLTQIMTQNNFKTQTQRMDIRSFYRQKKVNSVHDLAIETEHEFIRINLIYFILFCYLNYIRSDS